MNKIKSLFFAFVAILLFTKFGSAETPSLNNGIIDLTNVNWHNNVIKLEGNADFYWQEFLLSKSSSDSLPDHIKYLAPLPKPWTKIKLKDNTFIPAQGYGTYRIRIKVDNKDEVYGLKLRSIFSAYKLFINGKHISGLGVVGKNKEESVPRFLTQEIAIPILKKDSVNYQTLDIILHVSNYHHRRAGAQQPILFGRMDEIIDTTQNTIILNLFLIGIILIIGLNHVLMYALRRLDIGNLLFGLLSIIMILRNISTEERIIMHWFPDLDWELLVRLDNFSGFGTMSFFALFFFFAYRKSFPKVMFYILTGIGALVTILVFSSNAWFYGQFKLIFEAYIGLGGLYLVFGVLLRATFQKQKGAFITFIGMFLLYSTAVNDLLHSMGVINSAYIAPYGIAAFMVLQSFLLTKKSAIALLDNQELSAALNQEKQLLENRINKRTEELTKQADELKNYQKEQEKQNWINEGLNLITDVMRQNKDNLNELADQLLSNLIKRVNGSLGAMYLHSTIDSEEKLKLLAHYGLNKEAQLEFVDLKEGLTGQCYSLGKEKYMDDLPDSYFSISSGLGSSSPKVLALIPMKVDELVIGVVEIASFKTLSTTYKDFLKRAIDNISSQLNIVKMNDESRLVISESKKIEEEAKAKNREMRETMEEMQAIQEENELKSREFAKKIEEAKTIETELAQKLNNTQEELVALTTKYEKCKNDLAKTKKQSKPRTK